MRSREVGNIGLPDREREHHEPDYAEENGGPHLFVGTKRI